MKWICYINTAAQFRRNFCACVDACAKIAQNSCFFCKVNVLNFFVNPPQASTYTSDLQKKPSEFFCRIRRIFKIFFCANLPHSSTHASYVRNYFFFALLCKFNDFFLKFSHFRLVFPINFCIIIWFYEAAIWDILLCFHIRDRFEQALRLLFVTFLPCLRLLFLFAKFLITFVMLLVRLIFLVIHDYHTHAKVVFLWEKFCFSVVIFKFVAFLIHVSFL